MSDMPEKIVKTPSKTNKPDKIKTKRLSKGQRTHVRRMKQEARKEGVVYRPGIQ